VLKMCNDWRVRRESWREERFDEELRYLLDERVHSEPPAPVVEYERDEEPTDPQRLGVEASTRA
jgi:hypothetical protein